MLARGTVLLFFLVKTLLVSGQMEIDEKHGGKYTVARDAQRKRVVSRPTKTQQRYQGRGNGTKLQRQGSRPSLP